MLRTSSVSGVAASWLKVLRQVKLGIQISEVVSNAIRTWDTFGSVYAKYILNVVCGKRGDDVSMITVGTQRSLKSSLETIDKVSQIPPENLVVLQ